MIRPALKQLRLLVRPSPFTSPFSLLPSLILYSIFSLFLLDPYSTLPSPFSFSFSFTLLPSPSLLLFFLLPSLLLFFLLSSLFSLPSSLFSLLPSPSFHFARRIYIYLRPTIYPTNLYKFHSATSSRKGQSSRRLRPGTQHVQRLGFHVPKTSQYRRVSRVPRPTSTLIH